jgi:hypothetical protein
MAHFRSTSIECILTKIEVEELVQQADKGKYVLPTAVSGSYQVIEEQNGSKQKQRISFLCETRDNSNTVLATSSQAFNTPMKALDSPVHKIVSFPESNSSCESSESSSSSSSDSDSIVEEYNHEAQPRSLEHKGQEFSIELSFSHNLQDSSVAQPIPALESKGILLGNNPQPELLQDLEFINLNLLDLCLTTLRRGSRASVRSQSVGPAASENRAYANQKVPGATTVQSFLVLRSSRI